MKLILQTGSHCSMQIKFNQTEMMTTGLRPVFRSDSTKYMQKPPVFSPSRNACLCLWNAADDLLVFSVFVLSKAIPADELNNTGLTAVPIWVTWEAEVISIFTLSPKRPQNYAGCMENKKRISHEIQWFHRDNMRLLVKTYICRLSLMYALWCIYKPEL